MNAQTITDFYSEDHGRLDALFEAYRKLKDIDPVEARASFEKFKVGLEQHMAWEEAILFSEYDVRTNSVEGESETADLLAEHEQIRD